MRFKHKCEPSGRAKMVNLNMVPEAELAFFMSGAGHIVHVPYPPFPDCAGFGSIYSALTLMRIRRIGYFPFAASAGHFGIFFSV
jgi:hypothetical protein